ncbi:MAG: hypothetical protein HDT39_13295 [Lachnospiraceae bacterium]|nr:hypothetical protein [Lachnospiraceae bacterium]
MVKTVGRWHACPDIEIVEIEGRYIALFGWNGFAYWNCWEVKEIIDGVGFDIVKDGITARPIYAEEDLESDDFVDYIEPIGYNLEEA